MSLFGRRVSGILAALIAAFFYYPAAWAATAPAIIPASAPHGARVIVTGSGLQSPAAVSFTGTGGARVPAQIVARDAGLLELIVPASATTGPVVVASGATQVGALSFTLLPDIPFTKAATLAASDTAHDLFKSPSAVALTPAGLCVADAAHGQVKLVTSAGEIVVVAAGFKEPAGLVYDAARNVLYVADRGDHVIKRITVSGVSVLAGGSGPGDSDGTGAQASFKAPSGIAIDANGSIYVADTGNDQIRRVTPEGIVTTFAGRGTPGLVDGPALQASFHAPRGVAVSAAGVVYVADALNHAIRKIEAGVVGTIAGTSHPGFIDGPASTAEFNEPSGLAIDDAADIYIADRLNHSVRKLSSDAIVTTIAGTGAPGFIDGEPRSAMFKRPAALAYAGVLFVADEGNDAIRALYPQVNVAAVYRTVGPLAGGNTVRIFGTGFIAGATQVTFGTAAAAVTFVSSTEVIAAVPAGNAGSVDVLVRTPAGTDTLSNAYTYLPPPALATVTPRKLATAGGEQLTITGTGFVAGETTVTIGGADAPAVAVQSSTMLTCIAPPHAAGTVDATIVTPGGSTTLAGAATYFAPPTITAFTPLQGFAGTAVTIAGTNFDPDTADDRVLLGNVVALVTSAAPTQLVITVPAAALSGRITVTTIGGTATSSASFIVPTYTRITISPATASLESGDTLPLHASGVFPDNSTEDITARATWSSSNPSVATVDGAGIVHAAGSGSATISAAFAGFVASAAITVAASVPLPPDPATIAPPPDRTVVQSLREEVSFLYNGPNAIQTGVAANTIKDDRIAVLRGRVLTVAGTPLPAVTVTIAGHPEYGQTLSRADGYYDLVINGGAPLRLNFEKSGYVSAQRLVPTKWGDQKSVGDVALVHYDGQVTTVAMNAAAPQLAQGSLSSDRDGARRATVLFPAGTSATLVLPNGSTQTPSSLKIRATEFTVGPNGPKAMPGALPPSSAYTYCVELSADEAVSAGATEIRFSKTVPFYVENFLRFPVGIVVPAGFYDRVRGSWMSSDNGRVIKILAVTNGAADLDTNGDGAVDDAALLTARGIDDAERQQLATLYAPGQTLWRVPLTHFTPLDCNFPWGPPEDAVAPSTSSPRTRRRTEAACRLHHNSVVDCENQLLGEEVPITGTPFTLIYDSGRVARGAYRADISLSGEALPASLRSIELEIEIAGKIYQSTFEPKTNLSVPFIWDGIDAYGRTVQGARPARVTIGYTYRLQYKVAAEFDRAWAAFSNTPATMNASREEGGTVTFQQNWTVGLGNFAPQATGFGGWILDAQRLYDDRASELYDGPTNRASDPEGTGRAALRTVAGNGQCCDTGDGGAATQASLFFPQSMAAASDGSFYVSEFYKIKKIGTDGVIRTIAGTGKKGFTFDGLPALNHAINALDVAVGPDDTVYINDEGNYRVRRLVNGLMTTVAGNGLRATWPPAAVDGRKATEVAIDPQAITVAADGTLYLAENWRVTSVTPDGIMHLIAGTGAPNDWRSGDDGPAGAARVGPVAIAVGGDGSVYISDGVSAVRRITPDGIIRRFAGSYDGFSVPDGVSATSGRLTQPWGLAVAADGTLLIGSPREGRLRSVTPDGIIRTLAGAQTRDSSTPAMDGIMARSIGLSAPWDVKIDGSGSVLFIDYNRNIVRKTQPLFPKGGTVFASEDGSEAYVFQNGRHVRTADTLTGATLYQLGYDARGLLVSIADLDGNVTHIERNASGDPLAIVAPGGQRTTLATSSGMLTAVSNPAGESQQFTYDAVGLMLSRRDPRGTLFQYRYDDTGRLTRDEDPAGGFISLVRTESSSGYSVARTSAEGRTRTHSVLLNSDMSETRETTGADGLITRIIRGDGTRSLTLPDGTASTLLLTPDPRFGMGAPIAGTLTIQTPAGRRLTASSTSRVVLANAVDPLSVTTTTDVITRNGRSFTTTYDASTRKFTTTSPAGRHTYVTLDAKGRMISNEQPGLDVTRYAYDGTGLLTEIAAGARRMTFGYNARREMVSITDSLSRSLTFAYDPAGRVKSQTFPDGRSIVFDYDAGGNIIAVTPPARPQHGFVFTPVNLLESYVPPAIDSSAATHYSYNRDRQLTLISRPGATEIALIYDGAGRLASMRTADGTYAYTYTPETGALQAAVAPGGATMKYTYDGPLVTGVEWSGPISGSVLYNYDDDFRIARENGIQLGYDADGLLVAAGALSLQRDPDNGRVTSTTIGSLVDNYTYNTSGEITRYEALINGSPVIAFDYKRDDAGRITDKTETVFGVATTESYGYDPAGRLADVTRTAGGSAHYAYDANGNRSNGTYDVQDRLIADGVAAYTYTTNGELHTKTTAAGATVYEYDAVGSLRSVKLPDGTEVQYVTDPAGRRIGRKTNGVLSQGWLYAGDLRIVAELDASGAVVSRFVYGSRSNTPDYMEKGGRTYRILPDHRGSVRIVIDVESGAVAQMLGYDEFGNVLSDTNPGFQPFGFAGGLYDPLTGLVRFGARDYDPRVGRWTSKEPLGIVGGDTNFYVYVYNDPINLIDPSGLDAITSDPDMLERFYDLWSAAMYGQDSRERAAFITSNNNQLGCARWQWSATSRQEQWPQGKAWPPGVAAVVHTHPNNTIQGPSSGDKAESDRILAKAKISLPFYILTRTGIYKYDPTTRTTSREEDATWVDRARAQRAAHQAANQSPCGCQ